MLENAAKTKRASCLRKKKTRTFAPCMLPGAQVLEVFLYSSKTNNHTNHIYEYTQKVNNHEETKIKFKK